jgi:pyrroline-5-carboxylate reductase
MNKTINFGLRKLFEIISSDELITMVASPNGTTFAGLEVLEKASKVIENTIKAASDKSKELGKNE